MSFVIETTSVPDRDHVVVEIWWHDTMVAELHTTPAGRIEIEIYQSQSNDSWLFDLEKWIETLKKAQKELAKELVEVEAGDGAVVVQITGELKLKKVSINPDMVDLDDIAELESWIKVAVQDGMTAAQELAAEKMKPLMGGLGNLGL